MIRKLLLLILLVVLLFCGWNCKMVIYGLNQGVGQAKIIIKAKPVEKVMNDPDFPDSLKQKVMFVQEIRQFATDSLGLNDSENYTTIYDQKGEPVLWVLSVCEPYRLVEYKWDYPFLGEMAYKGFFDHKKALREEKKFKNKGYDTKVDNVSAWSTLGWFNDPILTGMLDRSEGELARLIIHELMHSTIFIKGNTDLNENLATFVGDFGAKAYLASRYGKGSAEYKKYLYRMSDVEKYSSHILRGADRLDSLYSSFHPEQSRKVKDSLKFTLIKNIMESADSISFHDKSRFDYLIKEHLPNNNLFITFKMYRKEQNEFELEFTEQFGGNFKKYLSYLKSKYE